MTPALEDEPLELSQYRLSLPKKKHVFPGINRCALCEQDLPNDHPNYEDLDTIDRLIGEGEASYNKWRHPDPYIDNWNLLFMRILTLLTDLLVKQKQVITNGDILILTLEDLDTIDRLIGEAEASYNKWRHPDPYIDAICTFEEKS
ncbi:hypothetical protein ZOSMA_253G00030 [Zostera marina]|uniref:NADH dehydrogenase [ubiquinone] 1 beta subcomplex subunit 9 n=1 Tax=Zostera marina TaxID=29655 RepID=A0A0K9PFN4_ZOSMR|nr:hypothetical protein ZOSMA_253G00030 [Zostera marina]